MAYNERKGWLDAQSEVMQLFVQLVKANDAAYYDFNDLDEARKQQFYLSNVRYGMTLHYRNYLDVAKAIRIRVDKDFEAGLYRVWAGTADALGEVTAPGHNKNAVKRLRGRTPSGAVSTPLKDFNPTPPVPPTKPKADIGLVTWNEGEVYTIDRLPELLSDAGIFNDPNSFVYATCQQLGLPKTNLTLAEAKLTIDSMTNIGFALENIDESEPVTFILFRKVGSHDS